ncbi:MAG: GNAT family N-acetyltransferase [Erythrobacter sp.]|nr:MAG: GNAT family N-acetyltransferase [Erythrobacter sp.]
MIRRLGPGDLPGLRALNRLFGEVFDEAENYTAAPPDDAYCAELLADRDIVLLLAEMDGQAVGGLAGYMLRKFERERAEFFIYDLGVDEAFRRQGIATALIDQARQIARECGAWTVFVQADVFPEDEPARRLYRKLAREEMTALHFDIAP